MNAIVVETARPPEPNRALQLQPFTTEAVGDRRRGVVAQISELRGQLEAIATPERAEQERAYLHSELEHLGVNQPGIRKIAGDYHRANKRELDDAQLRGLIDGLWRSSVHELRSLAIALAERWRKSLAPGDLDMFERWLRDAQTWAHVDWIAVKLVGSIVAAAADEDTEIGDRLDRWSRDEDFWLRRSSMLALLDPMRVLDGGDFPRFERYAIGEEI